MKKKFTTNAYMRCAKNYDIKIYNFEDFCLVVKKVNEVESPFITHIGQNIMDNGYFVLECTPKNENYSMRVFYNKKKQPLLYYFDITKEQGLDKETGVPYYIDIYTDIMIYTSENKIVVVDEDELKEALNKNEITKAEFNKANKVTKQLYKELQNNTNKYKNMDFTKFLK